MAELTEATAILETTSAGRNCILQLLVVEDNPVNQFIAKEMLEQLGCAVTLAVNGEQGCEQIRNHRFDLVLMDCQMPVKDGYEATQEIRSWEQENDVKATVIIALTAHALSGDRDKCLQAGMNDYLTKPFTIETLRNVVSENVKDKGLLKLS